jgi:hypothetical protein
MFYSYNHIEIASQHLSLLVSETNVEQAYKVDLYLHIFKKKIITREASPIEKLLYDIYSA